MVVDDKNLDEIVDNLQTKLSTNSQERRDIKIILNSARSIRLIEEPAPTDKEPDKTEFVLPQDTKLGVTITEERRNEIYGKIVYDVSKV